MCLLCRLHEWQCCVFLFWLFAHLSLQQHPVGGDGGSESDWDFLLLNKLSYPGFAFGWLDVCCRNWINFYVPTQDFKLKLMKRWQQLFVGKSRNENIWWRKDRIDMDRSKEGRMYSDTQWRKMWNEGSLN